MAVLTTGTVASYLTAAPQSIFAFPYVLPDADLLVVSTTVGAVETIRTRGVDYTVALPSGGVGSATVTFLSPVAAGVTVRLERILPFTQPTVWRGTGTFSPATWEDALDRLTMMIQQLDGGTGGGGGGSGEVNTGENVNTEGLGLFAGKSGTVLQFLGLKAGPGVSLAASPGDGTIEITSTAGSFSTGMPDHIQAGQSGAAGSSPYAARLDHSHLVQAGTAQTIGTSNSAGLSGAFSRADHVHAHGDQPGGTLHAEATETTPGFMTPTDKVAIATLSAAVSTHAGLISTNAGKISTNEASIGAIIEEEIEGEYVWDGSDYVLVSSKDQIGVLESLVSPTGAAGKVQVIFAQAMANGAFYSVFVTAGVGNTSGHAIFAAYSGKSDVDVTLTFSTIEQNELPDRFCIRLRVTFV